MSAPGLKAFVAGHSDFPAETNAAILEMAKAGIAVVSLGSKTLVGTDGRPLFAKDATHEHNARAATQAIAMADMLWLVAPTGMPNTAGQAMIGAAYALRIPAFCLHPVLDETLGLYVHTVTDLNHAVGILPQAKRAVEAASASAAKMLLEAP